MLVFVNFGCAIGISRVFRNRAVNSLIPIAEPEFTNSCACRIPPLPALSPLVKGGEGRGEGDQHPLPKLNSTCSRSASSTVPSQLRSSLR
jgi:hypothetical protein